MENKNNETVENKNNETVENKNNETVSKATKKTSSSKSKSSDTNAKKIKELEKTIKDLNNLVQMLVSKSMDTPSQVNNLDRDVVIISLCGHILNLSTEPYGAGTTYSFSEFGEEQSIPYSDVKKIIKNNKSFIKGGKCYILDNEIVKTEHLEKDYEKLLTKDGLLELLNADRGSFLKIFDSMTSMQKELFRDVVVDRLTENRNSVDMNIVQHINDSLKTDLLANIDLSNELLK